MKRNGRKRKKSHHMTLHLLPLRILLFMAKVMCVCPTAAPPGPHRIWYLTAMPTQAHTGMTTLSRTNSVQITHQSWIRWTSSRASMSPPAATSLQPTPQDLSPPGLKGVQYRPQGTACSPQTSRKQHSNLQYAREEHIKEDPWSFFFFFTTILLYLKLFMLSCYIHIYIY